MSAAAQPFPESAVRAMPFEGDAAPPLAYASNIPQGGER